MRTIGLVALFVFSTTLSIGCKQENGGCRSDQTYLGTTAWGEPFCIDRHDTLSHEEITTVTHEVYGRLHLIENKWVDSQGKVIAFKE